jgi:HEAT repeats
MATTHALADCKITVTLALEYHNNTGLGAADFQTLIDGWNTAITNMWNGPRGSQPFGCCTVSFRVDSRVGSGTNGYHQVTVGPDDVRSSVAQVGVATSSGTWDRFDSGTVIAHEAGHLLGLPDEYHDGPDGLPIDDNPQPAGNPPSIMASTASNAVVLPEHITKVMTALGATCPRECCPPSELVPSRPVPADNLHVPTRRGGRGLPSPYRGAMMLRPVPALLDHLLAGPPSAQGEGEYAILARGDAAVPDLLKALSSDSDRHREVAVRLLGTLGAAKAKRPIQGLLASENLSLRISAAVALYRLGSTAGLGVLIAALGEDRVINGHPPQAACIVADKALRRLSGKDMGFDASSWPERRSEAAARWQAWAEAQKPV